MVTAKNAFAGLLGLSMGITIEDVHTAVFSSANDAVSQVITLPRSFDVAKSIVIPQAFHPNAAVYGRAFAWRPVLTSATQVTITRGRGVVAAADQAMRGELLVARLNVPVERVEATSPATTALTFDINLASAVNDPNKTMLLHSYEWAPESTQNTAVFMFDSWVDNDTVRLSRTVGTTDQQLHQFFVVEV